MKAVKGNESVKNSSLAMFDDFKDAVEGLKRMRAGVISIKAIKK